jgi:hypothetical protein
VVHKGLVYGMKWAQLPMCRNDHRLHSGMRTQPTIAMSVSVTYT